VLEAIVEWGMPVAALLRVTWLEPCDDRLWAWGCSDSDPRHPDRVWMMPRVEYDYPGGGAGNPATSMWVIWEPGRSGGCELRHFGKQARDGYQGQTTLLEEIS